MIDERHQKLARVLVNYSLEIKPEDKLLIASQVAGAPLAREVYREALRAGAHPTARITLDPSRTRYSAFDSLTELKVAEGNESQLRYVSELNMQTVEHFDAILTIWADENTKAFSGFDPARLALFQQSQKGLLQRYFQRAADGELRWCLTLFPTHAHAQDTGMSLTEFEDFVFGAGLLHSDDPAAAWREVRAQQQHIADYLGTHDEIHIVAPGTDLKYRVGGRTWINASGLRNFPDGEVFTGPVESSVSGKVCFTYPAVFGGTEVEDVRLTFEDGKVVHATAARGQSYMESLLDQDPGARYVGEAAFGLNYGVKQFTRNILFDEKIGGTMHLALGNGYPETGSKNESALHWDMICDLREGRVFADGKLCYEGGRFII